MAKRPKQKDIEARKKASAPTLPEYRDGTEEVGMEELIFPRLKLIQSNCSAFEDKAFKGKVGQFFNTLTGECFDDFLFIPLQFRRFMVETDDEQSNFWGLEDVGIDAPKELKSIHFTANGYWALSPEQQKKYVLVHSFIGLYHTENTEKATAENLAVLNFARTNLKGSQKIITQMRFANKKLYECEFNISSKFKKNDKGSWYITEPNLSDVLKDEGKAKMILEILKSLAAMNIEKTVKEEVGDYKQEVNNPPF